MADTSWHILIVCKVSPTAGQAVEIQWKRESGTGLLTCHERTLTLYKTDAANIKEATATADQVDTNNTDALLNSMTLTPGADEWLAIFSSSYQFASSGPNITCFPSLYVAGSQISHTEREPVVHGSIDVSDQPFATNGVVNPGASDDVEVQWRGSAITNRTCRERTLILLKESGVAPPTFANKAAFFALFD